MSMTRDAGNKVVIAASQSKAPSGTCAAQLGQLLYNLDRGRFSKTLSRILDGTASRNDLKNPAFLPAILVVISFITKRI